jgi:hypothetical protein
MKFIIICLIVITSISLEAQETFKFDKNGLNPQYVVKKHENLDKGSLYVLSIDWAANSKKHQLSIGNIVKNESIQLTGKTNDLICINAAGREMCYETIYKVKINFKDGRLKFEPISIAYSIPSGTNKNIDLSSGADFYKNNGKVRNVYKSIPSNIADLFNQLHIDLSKHIDNKNGSEDDW